MLLFDGCDCISSRFDECRWTTRGHDQSSGLRLKSLNPAVDIDWIEARAFGPRLTRTDTIHHRSSGLG